MEWQPAIIEFQFHEVPPAASAFLGCFRLDAPTQIRILGQELPEMECQLALVADNCAFTGF
ncbi:MAG: hypothetical protein ABMA01_19650 [Chthoniobacteraceae bacterium]